MPIVYPEAQQKAEKIYINQEIPKMLKYVFFVNYIENYKLVSYITYRTKGTKRHILFDIPHIPVFSICILEEKTNEYFKSKSEKHGNKGKKIKKRRLHNW